MHSRHLRYSWVYDFHNIPLCDWLIHNIHALEHVVLMTLFRWLWTVTSFLLNHGWVLQSNHETAKLTQPPFNNFLHSWFKILFWWFHTFKPCRSDYSRICETFNKFKSSREETIVGEWNNSNKNFYSDKIEKKNSLKIEFSVIKNLLETDINIIDFFPMSQLISVGACVALTLSAQLFTKSSLINKIRLTLLILSEMKWT